ncbi:MAG: hypothetical protein AB7S72_18035 [Draconibacterium sp.]
MATVIKIIPDGNLIEFDKGKIDDWCVYVTKNRESRFAPTDILYFSELKQLGEKHGHRKIYDDFVKIYNNTNSKIDEKTLSQITDIASGYGDNKTPIDIWFTVIYAGMIAEENKKFAILKKRVKRLGMYQLLIERESPEYAANFSKGQPWRVLDIIMKKKGF